MSAVIQVVAVIGIVDIDIVRVIPIAAPVSRIWIDHAEPVTAILETRISANNEEGKTTDPESMPPSKVATEAVVGNAISVVSAALLPTMVVCLPVARAVLLPSTLLKALLLWRALESVVAACLLRVLL